MLSPIVSEDSAISTQLRAAIGAVIRAARRQRGLTLRDVARLSGSRLKASALGAYERAERLISLERFFDLSTVYGVPADRLLAEALDRLTPEGRVEVVVDLRELEQITGEEPRRAAELVARVRNQREGEQGDVLILRAGDLQALALASGLSQSDLIRRLDPAVRVRRSSLEGESGSPTSP